MALETDKEAGIVTIIDDYSGDIDTWEFNPEDYGYGTENEDDGTGGFGLIFTIIEFIIKEFTQEITGGLPPEQADALEEFKSRGWVEKNFGGGGSSNHFADERNMWKFFNTVIRKIFNMIKGKPKKGKGGKGRLLDIDKFN